MKPVPLDERHRQGALPEAAPSLAIRDLTKRWPRHPEPVLDAVSLTVAPGSVVFIRGRNGAGKTTLLRIAAGMIRPDGGSVRINGLDPRADRREYQRSVGFLAAGNSGLYARLQVRLHLDYWARIAFVEPSDRERSIERTIDRFSLQELAPSRCDRLSLGQRQRLRLALVFLHEPAVALLDEPANSLDDDAKALLRTIIDDFVARGGSVVWCAPSAEGVGLAFDRGYVIEAGRLTRA